jgi:hypothetical protein
LHYSFVLHWTPAVKKNGIPLDTNGFHSKALDKRVPLSYFAMQS